LNLTKQIRQQIFTLFVQYLKIQELTSDLPMPDGFSESDDNSVNQLSRKRLRSLGGLRHSMMSSLSSSSRSSRHMSQLNSELNEYKRRCEEAERKVNRQAQQLQEMEAKQREMEQKIEFLLSQLQLPRDPPT
jgi:chromosome segregation ATPase